MQLTDFQYTLPETLIAQYPLSERTQSRLFVPEKTSPHLHFSDLPSLLHANDLLVFNDTRVIPARLFGQKQTGGKIEILIERVLTDKTALAQLRASKTPKAGAILTLDTGANTDAATEVTVMGRQGELFELKFHITADLIDFLNQCGHIPLPPYIERADELSDQTRYQTVYAKQPGAVAAPTAGLHFDQPLLDELSRKGIQQTFVTLHVGAGTFQPVRVDNIAEHTMHAERVTVTEQTCEQIKQCKARGGRVIAVGTTVVRCLETACASGQIMPYEGETNIFITPGYAFQCVDTLITNFHLPGSTLLMLVCAFGGYEPMMQAYQQAVAAQYRFFSYGDAMLIQRHK